MSDRTFVAFLVVLAALAPVAVGADKDHDKPQGDKAAEKSFPNVKLIDQDGKTVRFSDDVLKGKIVVINSFFTTCTTICPALTANIAKLQKSLGERAGKDVVIVSITVDPAVDTPARLKAYAKSFKAGPGWLFLTGTKGNVDVVLKRFGFFTADRTDHPPTVMIGNEPTGLWTRANGLTSPKQLQELVESVTNDKAGDK